MDFSDDSSGAAFNSVLGSSEEDEVVEETGEVREGGERALSVLVSSFQGVLFYSLFPMHNINSCCNKSNCSTKFITVPKILVVVISTHVLPVAFLSETHKYS